MDTLLSDLKDEIIVSCSNPEESPQLLNEVVDRISQYEFHLQADKSEFFRTAIRYLGIIFDKSVRRSDAENIYVIQHNFTPFLQSG